MIDKDKTITINEGWRKGGFNTEITQERPAPPKGQKLTMYNPTRKDFEEVFNDWCDLNLMDISFQTIANKPFKILEKDNYGHKTTYIIPSSEESFIIMMNEIKSNYEWNENSSKNDLKEYMNDYLSEYLVSSHG